MSGVEYEARDGWRPRGRPPKRADPAVVASLRKTYEFRSMGRLTLGPDTSLQDVRDTIAELKRAAKELGLRLRLQPRQAPAIFAEGELRFFGEDSE